ncbi:hypothetical protein, partial [Intestinibacter sp.]|uniref:hypothetical protein n=1 Tax=Intestinibacter sp. TaxID=1965304 RepID=UPI003F18024F
MKIYNPYENKKTRLIEYIKNNCLLKIYYNFLKIRNDLFKIFKCEDRQNCKLDRDYEFLTHKSSRKRTVEKLSKNEEIKITDFFIEELISIELLDNLEKGLYALLNKFPPTSFIAIQHNKDIKEFIIKIKENYHYDGWFNVGFIEFPKESELHKFVKYVQINLQSFSVSHVRINFMITLKESYNKEIFKIVEKEYQDVNNMYFYKTKHRGIGVLKVNGEIYKKRDVQNKLLYLKWRVLKYISNYIPLYFFDKN